MSGGASYAATVNLPPPFRLVALRAGEAFERAQEMAADAAGTLVLSPARDRFDCALVLEPEAPLDGACRVHLAGMLALAETVEAAAPSARIEIGWPATLLIDGRHAGGGRLAWPEGAPAGAVPDWLVFGLRLDLSPLPEAVAEPARLAEVFVRRFLAALNLWYERGFPALAEAVERRLATMPGASRIDADGALVTQQGAGERRQPLLAVLADLSS